MRRRLWFAALSVFLLFTSVSAKADEVDTAFDLVFAAGHFGGISFGETEKAIAKSLVRCAMAKKSVLACARDHVTAQLPDEAGPLVDCILLGRRIEDCAARQALDMTRLPAEAKAVITCITQRSDIGACAHNTLSTAAQKQVLLVIDALKADARSNLADPSAKTIQNIIGVARGIKDDDYVMVFLYGGTEVYKAAGKIVLNVVLPGISAIPVAGDISDAMIQNGADFVTSFVQAARRGDVAAIGEAAVEHYLLHYTIPPCQLVSGDLREATCGNIAKFIHALGGVFGDVLTVAWEVIKDPLGAPTTIWDATQRGRELAVRKRDDCEWPDVRYAETYFQCYHSGVQRKLTSPDGLSNLIGDLNGQCRRYYGRCYFSNRFDQLCNPQREMYQNHVDRIANALRQGARTYSRSLAGFVRNSGAACNQATFRREHLPRFIQRCEQTLERLYPLDFQDRAGGGCPRPAYTAYRAACEQAIAQVDLNAMLQKVCSPPDMLPPMAPSGCRGEGRCGYLRVRCDAPLPRGDRYVLAIGNLGLETDASAQGGGLTAKYLFGGPGEENVSVCTLKNNMPGVCAQFPMPVGDSQAPECAPAPYNPAHHCTSPLIWCNGACRPGIECAQGALK